MDNFMLLQRIKKRENQIAINKSEIERLQKRLQSTTDEFAKRQITQKINQLTTENEQLNRKNKRFEW